MFKRSCAAATLAASFWAASAQGATLSFFCITNNSPTNCATGVSQLSVDVDPYGTNQVLFSFKNAGPLASSITDVYFDNGSLLDIATLIDKDDGVGGHSGVDFSEGASPPNLPGGNLISPAFQVTAGFLADSDAPVSQRGVNPLEWLGVVFSLQGTQSYSDVITELETGEIRVGMQVQSFSNGMNESLVNYSLPVPLPGALFLLLSGLMALRGTQRLQQI